MGVLNRTPEFAQILAELSVKEAGPSKKAPTGSQPQAQSEFNAWSADIGAGINQASLRVQELRKMARQKSIFNDKTREIQQLTGGIAEQLQMLEQKAGALEKKVNSKAPNRSYEVHTRNAMNTLKTRLGEVAKDFKDALDDRRVALEQQDERKQIYSAGRGFGAKPSMQMPRASHSDALEDGGVQQLDLQQGYHSSRAEAVKNVQKTIGEVAQMMHKMASVVTSQDEHIQRLEDDVDRTLENVDAGQEHVLRYFKHMSSNRSLILKVFIILIFFVVFFVVFLA